MELWISVYKQDIIIKIGELKMLSNEEIQQWLINNCLDNEGKYIMLSGLDLRGYTVDISNMQATDIRQHNHKADNIIQGCHKATYISQHDHESDLIFQSRHKADHISQDSHVAFSVIQGSHNACYISQGSHKANYIDQGHHKTDKLVQDEQTVRKELITQNTSDCLVIYNSLGDKSYVPKQVHEGWIKKIIHKLNKRRD